MPVRKKKGSILGPNLSLFTVSFVSSYAISHGRHSCARGKFLLALLSSHQRVKVEEDVGALRFFQLGRDLDHNRADIPYSLSVLADYQFYYSSVFKMYFKTGRPKLGIFEKLA